MIKTVGRSILGTCLVLGYPYLVYQSIQSGVVWFAPTIIASIYMIQAFEAERTQVRIKAVSIVAILLLGSVLYPDIMAKLIPVVIQFSLMVFFGKTLKAGKGPSLVERFAAMDFPEIPPAISQYCRYLTMMWTGFFAFNIGACIVLAIFAPVSWWAWYTGVLIFMLSGLLMVGEYIWRHFFFRRLDLPNKQIPDVKSSIKSMMVNGKAIWLDVHAQ